MLSRLLRTLLFIAVVIPAIPALRAADRGDQRESRRLGRRCAAGCHRRGSRRTCCRRRASRRPASTASIGCRRCRPATYTLTFVLAGMQNVTRQAEVQLSQDTVVDAHARPPGRDRERRGHRHGEPDREGHGDHQERVVERADHVAAGRAGISRPPQADSRRPVHAGQRRAARARAAAARTTSTSSTA